MKTLRLGGIAKVPAGHTDLAEVLCAAGVRCGRTPELRVSGLRRPRPSAQAATAAVR